MLTKSSRLILFIFVLLMPGVNVVVADPKPDEAVSPLQANSRFEYAIVEITPVKEETDREQTSAVNVSDQSADKYKPTGNEQDSNSHIIRSQFTTAIVNREPTDDVVMLTNNSNKIYYFSELTDMDGHSVIHHWQYQGKTMAEIKFNVKGDRWRVFSSKTIRPDWTGNWSVVLTDEKGQLLTKENLQVVEASGQ